MSDKFDDFSTGLSSPAKQAFAIAPNDAADLTVSTRGIYVGSGGNLRLLLVGDTTPVTFENVIGGVTHPFRVRRVYATGTDATGLIGVL